MRSGSASNLLALPHPPLPPGRLSHNHPRAPCCAGLPTLPPIHSPAGVNYTTVNDAVLALGGEALPGEWNKTDKL